MIVVFPDHTHYFCDVFESDRFRQVKCILVLLEVIYMVVVLQFITYKHIQVNQSVSEMT